MNKLICDRGQSIPPVLLLETKAQFVESSNMKTWDKSKLDFVNKRAILTNQKHFHQLEEQGKTLC